LELFDYVLFFRNQEMPVSDAAAQYLEIPAVGKLTYFPRRGFDLWNARYFIVPIRTDNWKSADRGYAAFLPETELVYPAPGFVLGTSGESWRENEDWQVLRNNDAYPRAWLVHFV